MDKQEFLARLTEILEVDKDDLQEDVKLNADNWDSISHVSAIALIDELYDMTVDTSALSNCRSVGELVSLVRSHVD